MVWGKIAGEVAYSGFAGFLIATAATAFVVFATGLPLVVGGEEVLLASLASICVGGVVASASVFSRLERDSPIESVRTP